MTPAELLGFFKQIDSTKLDKFRVQGSTRLDNSPIFEYPLDGAIQWVTKARTALHSLLPPEHAILRQLNEVLDVQSDVTEEYKFDQLRAVFHAATEMLEGGQLSSVVQGIRAETTAELLDQAEQLATKGNVTAAAVLAGGALETHLHGLCVRYKLSWDGQGSISKYDTAIARARNAGAAVYDASYSKSITAWGGLRNDAAHSPMEFNADQARVQVMIDGIRQFIASCV